MVFLPQNEMLVSAERKDHESVTGVPENTGQLRGKSVFVDRADPASVPVREHHTGNLTADPRWRTHIPYRSVRARSRRIGLQSHRPGCRFPVSRKTAWITPLLSARFCRRSTVKDRLPEQPPVHTGRMDRHFGC